jgi:cysteine desulfurase
MIYLDHAATTPISEEALSAYCNIARKYFGNASSIHDYGTSAKQILDAARKQIAQALGAESRGIYFTGSGSEANQLAIQSLVRANRHKGNHIITTAAEHASVRNTLRMLHEQGLEVTYTPLCPSGAIDLEQLRQNIRPETILATLQHGNSEIGTVQNLEALGRLLKEHGVLFHSDCVQTFGKLSIDVKAAGLDSVSVSAHKIYGPKGIGAVYIAPAARWKPVFPGTTQEKGFRAGTVDVPAVGAFMVAVRQAAEQMEAEFEREMKLRNLLLEGLRQLPFEITVEGAPDSILPSIVGLRIHGMEGQYAMLECNRRGLAISTGSACTVGTEKASATMIALERSEQEAREFVRLSLGRSTTQTEIGEALEILKKVLTEHFNMVKL